VGVEWDVGAVDVGGCVFCVEVGAFSVVGCASCVVSLGCQFRFPVDIL
jgi:hypothetical protein